MGKMRLLTNALLITAFSCIAIALYSCDPEDSPTFRDYLKLVFVNTTQHRLDIRYNGCSLEEQGRILGFFISPNGTHDEEYRLSDSIYVCYKDFFGSSVDSLQIYINGELRKNYVGPIKDLPDSIHDVYNINSWKFGKYLSNYGNTKGDSLETLTFTFTDEDFADDASRKNETE
jgi:hypothetical protein